jgi:hypothetical protein
MPFMHDPTLQVVDAAIATWEKLCPGVDLPAELQKQPWTMLHERSTDKRLGAYWLLPCGMVAVIRKTFILNPEGKQIGMARLRLVTFLTPAQCKEAMPLPEPRTIQLTEEQQRQGRRRHEKARRKRRQVEKQQAT